MWLRVLEWVAENFYLVVTLWVALIVLSLAGPPLLRRLRKRRLGRSRQALATRLGFSYSERDPHITVGLPFSFFNRGDGRWIEHVLDGSHAGRPVRLFDYTYYEQSENKKREFHFSCAVRDIGTRLPELELGRETFVSRLVGGLNPDIAFDLEAFNREFRVQGKDRKFAFALVDQRMMLWLLSVDHRVSFAVSGAHVLVHRARCRSEELPALLDLARAFEERIPRVVSSLYPSA